MPKRHVLILAGGKGTRMGAAVPKALVPICGSTIIDWMLASIQNSGIDADVTLVIGHDLQMIPQHVGDRAHYVIQQEQKGTGHAVMVAREALKEASLVLVVYGDHPLYTPEEYRRMVEAHESGSAVITMLTTVLPNFDGWRSVYAHFGRIVRDADGNVLSIKEERLCNENERAIKEVNNGMYCFDGAWLWEEIDRISQDNPKSEYLLTDMVEVALQQGKRVQTVACDPEHGVGVNTPEEVAIAEEVLCGKRAGA